jgi:hypothetical protein
MKMQRLLVVLAMVLGLTIPASAAFADPPPGQPLEDRIPTLPGNSELVIKDVASEPGGGARAACALSATLDAIACIVEDSKADKSDVFVEWKSVNGQKGRMENKDNTGSAKTFVESGLWRGIDASTFQWKVCVDKRFDNDPCSAYVNHAIGPDGVEVELDCVPAEAGSTAAAYACHQRQIMAKDQGWELSRECVSGIGESVAAQVVSTKGEKVVVAAKWTPYGKGIVFAWGVYNGVTDCR